MIYSEKKTLNQNLIRVKVQKLWFIFTVVRVSGIVYGVDIDTVGRSSRWRSSRWGRRAARPRSSRTWSFLRRSCFIKGVYFFPIFFLLRSEASLLITLQFALQSVSPYTLHFFSNNTLTNSFASNQNLYDKNCCFLMKWFLFSKIVHETCFQYSFLWT